MMLFAGKVTIVFALHASTRTIMGGILYRRIVDGYYGST